MDYQNYQAFVVDTSVTAKLFLTNEELSAKAEKMYQQASRNKIVLLAPELIYYEVTSVLNKSDMSLSEIKESLSYFDELIKNESKLQIPHKNGN